VQELVFFMPLHTVIVVDIGHAHNLTNKLHNLIFFQVFLQVSPPFVCRLNEGGRKLVKENSKEIKL
jgi:hypothetical protein